MAFGAQGRLPRIVIEGRMCGKDSSGNVTNNSVIYRGRPYCRENAIDMDAIDSQREKVFPSQQIGLRIVAMAMSTSRVLPTNS